jgi:hypothetical protein
MDMDYEKICSQIFMIDPKIRFAAVYDFWAKRIAGGMKEGLDSHLAEKITINSVNQALLRWKSRKTMEEWIGKATYAMAEYEKVKRLTFYFNENELLLVSTEPDADHEKIIKNIKKLLSDSSLPD